MSSVTLNWHFTEFTGIFEERTSAGTEVTAAFLLFIYFCVFWFNCDNHIVEMKTKKQV